LMNDPSIEEFYPVTFSIDENDIPKIPFVRERELLSVLESSESKLTDDEKQRNKFRKALLFEYKNQKANCTDFELNI
ncbi:36721_t:CDS:2, partial [Racocetra persica]